MIALWTILSSLAAALLAFQPAARLSEHGTCRVLEREAHLAYHSSGRSAALYEENYGSPSTIALAKAGRADWDDFSGRRT
jgi:glycine/D-amino acid oxidase-like deaminating enzyme